MEKEQDKKFFEKVLKANERYYTKFRELVLMNRKVGRDHQVLLDCLDCRDGELAGTGQTGDKLFSYLKLHRWNYLFYDQLFSQLERKVNERLNGII